jgi:adenylate cyclase
MRAALAALNADWRRRGLAELDNGVGLASGPVVAGQIGSPKRLEFTVIGDTVNLAARMEAMTRQVEAPLVFDTATAVLLAGDLELRPASLGSREVKGIGPVELFGVEATAPGQA